MDLKAYCAAPDEKPLDRIVPDGGLCRIFRSIACIGDSLSSGEFEGRDENGAKTYHDFFEYSWGQYIARAAGIQVYNFSRGGMTASEYLKSFAGAKGFWDEKLVCQAYIIALGVNDLIGQHGELGTADDIHWEQYGRSADNFAGNLGMIIQQLKVKQPDAKFFLVTMPKGTDAAENLLKEKHAALLKDIASRIRNTYVIDLYRYAPVYDSEFKRNFYLGGHMNPAGYVLTADMIMSYIDFIIRNDPEHFAQIPFIGKPYRNTEAIW